MNFVKVGLCEFSFTNLQLYSPNCVELRGTQKNEVMISHLECEYSINSPDQCVE